MSFLSLTTKIEIKNSKGEWTKTMAGIWSELKYNIILNKAKACKTVLQSSRLGYSSLSNRALVTYKSTFPEGSYHTLQFYSE